MTKRKSKSQPKETKRRGAESATSGRRIEAREHEQRAVALRKAHATYRQIGTELGISHVSAYRAVKRALAEIESETAESAAELKRLELERLDAMGLAIWERVRAGEVEAIDRALKVSAARRSLLGLDAPSKTAFTEPDGRPLDQRPFEVVLVKPGVASDPTKG